MTKMFKTNVALGSQIAPLHMAWFTYWYQSKNDFFGPSSDLTPLAALETPTNLWKHLAICQYLTQDTKSTKIDPSGGFLALGMTIVCDWRREENWLFASFSKFLSFISSVAFPVVTVSTTRYQMKGLDLSFPLVPLNFIQEYFLGSGDWSKTSGWTVKIQFFTPFLQLIEVVPIAKINPPKGLILVLFVSWVRYWHMAKCFQRFVSVSRAVKWVRTKLGLKKPLLGWNPPVKGPFPGGAIWDPKTTLFNFFCHFLK